MAKDNNGEKRKAYTEKELSTIKRTKKTLIFGEINKLYQDVVDKAMEKLKSNKELFKTRFGNYFGYWEQAEEAITPEIKSILNKIKKANCNLGIYSANSSDKSFDLRYQGTPIASISIKGKSVFLEKRDNAAFPQGLSLGPINENSLSELSSLSIEDDNKENKVEFQLLNYINSSSGLRYIIPITKPKGVAYIQFPSAFKASKVKNKLTEMDFSDPSRGRGIDILARQKGNTLLTIEVKDQFSTSELPEDAIKQSILYSCEMCYLVRMNDDWFQKLLINKNPDKSLLIKAVIAMPFADDPKEIITDFQVATKARKLEIHTGKTNISGEEIVDSMELHYLFFNKPEPGKSINFSTMKTSLKKT